MERVYEPGPGTFGGVRYAAIAIKSISPHQNHVAIVHVDPNSGAPLMLHLAWHFDLRNEEANDRYHWVDPDLPKPRLRSVAALCRQIWRKNGKNAIPYAFSHPSDCFDGGTGEFLLGPTKLGLTCATFVLAVFESAGIRLIDYASPVPARSGDREWQEKIVDLLERQGATSEHVDAVKGQIGGVRYRPEDVAGGATVSPLPAEFDLAAERGRQIVERLQSQ